MGSSLAFVSNVKTVAGWIVPLVAALLIVSFGYSVLFSVALFFVFMSLVPVFPLQKEKTNFKFSLKSIAEFTRKNKHFILPEILDNLGHDAGVVWMLFIFTVGLTVLDLGYFGVMSGTIGMIVTYVTGFLIDKWDKQKVIRLGAVLVTLAWIASYGIAVYSPTPVMLFIVTVFRGFAIGIFAISYGEVLFNRARNDDAQFIVLREIPTIFERLIVFTVSLIFKQ